MEIHPEDHGGSPGRRIQKDVEVSQFQHTVKMVDDTAESSEDSADAAGAVHRKAGYGHDDHANKFPQSKLNSELWEMLQIQVPAIRRSG